MNFINKFFSKNTDNNNSNKNEENLNNEQQSNDNDYYLDEKTGKL